MKSILHYFLKPSIDKTIFLEGESPSLNVCHQVQFQKNPKNRTSKVLNLGLKMIWLPHFEHNIDFS